MTKKAVVIIAEFSIHPIGSGTSVGRYVRAAVRAFSRIPGLKYQVTPMATLLEARHRDYSARCRVVARGIAVYEGRTDIIVSQG